MHHTKQNHLYWFSALLSIQNIEEKIKKKKREYVSWTNGERERLYTKNCIIYCNRLMKYIFTYTQHIFSHFLTFLLHNKLHLYYRWFSEKLTIIIMQGANRWVFILYPFANQITAKSAFSYSHIFFFSQIDRVYVFEIYKYMLQIYEISRIFHSIEKWLTHLG